MTAEPLDWNIVVVAAWNLAILTPEGVAQRLFGLQRGIPVEIEVPIDVRGPVRVRHDGLLVVPASDRLIVSPTLPTPQELARAATLATKAITALRETPMSAAGINVRFKLEPMPESLSALCEAKLDDSLSDEKLEICDRGLNRSISWGQGRMNLEIRIDDKQVGLVAFNFHRGSSDPLELKEWLASTETMATKAIEVAKTTLGIEMEAT